MKMLNVNDMLPSDAHRAMLGYLRQNARGRLRSIPRDSVRAALLSEYGITLVDRDMRQIRSDLVAWGYPCYPGPAGYYYGVEAADLHDARSYIAKKVMPLLEERKQMRFAFEAEMRRRDMEPQRQMDLLIPKTYPMGIQTVKVPR